MCKSINWIKIQKVIQKLNNYIISIEKNKKGIRFKQPYCKTNPPFGEITCPVR